MDYEAIRRVVEAFDRHEVAYAIFGAAALNFHGLARSTEDLDLFVAPTEDNVARLKSALHEVFGDPSIDEISAEDLLGDYPAVYRMKKDTVRLKDRADAELLRERFDLEDDD